jgi:hypothetical protein
MTESAKQSITNDVIILVARFAIVIVLAFIGAL